MAQSAIMSFVPKSAKTNTAWRTIVMRSRSHVRRPGASRGTEPRRWRRSPGRERILPSILARVLPTGLARAIPTVLTLAAATLVAGCTSRNTDEEPLRPGPSGTRTEGGLEYGGELLVMESFPVQLAANITLTNVEGGELDVSFPDGCVVLLRAYAGDRKVWDQAASTVCTMAIQSVVLKGGESRAFRASTSAYEVLGDSLPDGSYRMTAYLRPAGETVEIELGKVDLAIPRRGS